MSARRPTVCLALALALTALLLHPAATARVPADPLEPALHDELARQYPTVPRHRHHELVYRVTANLTTLSGRGLRLDLRSGDAATTAAAARAALVASLVWPHDAGHLLISPADRVRPGPGAMRTVGPGFSATLSPARDRVLAVSTPRHRLVPLHATDFPDVLVDARAPYLRLSAAHTDVVADMREPDDADADDVGYTGFIDDDHDEDNDVGPALAPTARQQTACRDGRVHLVEVAIAVDSKFCAAHAAGSASVAKAVVQDIVLTANRAYARNTCVRLALVHVDAQCDAKTDPYIGLRAASAEGCFPPACNPGGQVLKRFARFWRTSRRTVRRDVAFMLSGGSDSDPIAGVASLGGACSAANGYGWVEERNAFVLAHELAHTLGATHARFGLMRAVVVGDEQLKFSEFSANEINRFVDRYAAFRCVDPQPPRCDASCPARCVDGLCVLPRAPGPRQVACALAASAVRCAVPKRRAGKQRFFADGCPEKFNVVKRAYDPNDLSSLCCAAPAESRSFRVVPRDYRLFTLVTPGTGGAAFERTPNYVADERDIRDATLMVARVEECASATPAGPKSPAAGGPAGEKGGAGPDARSANFATVTDPKPDPFADIGPRLEK